MVTTIAQHAGRCAECWVPFLTGAPVVRLRRRLFQHVACEAPDVLVYVQKEAA